MKFKKCFNIIIVFLLILACTAIFLTSFFTSIYYDMHVDVDFPHYTKETLSHLVLSMLIVFVVFWLVDRKRVFAYDQKMLLFALLFCSLYCLFLIFTIKPLPVDDSMLLDKVINQFSEGDYSSLTKQEGYLYIWPFQLGYVFFGQLMTKAFGAGNYLAWDLVQLLSILITVCFLYRICWEFYESRIVCSIMSLMSVGMLFFYNYVTFIYGDILSMAPQTIALYLIVRYLKKERISYAFLAGPLIGVAVVLKTNCEITLIAMCIIVLLSAFKDSRDYRANELTVRFVQRLLICAFLVIVVFGCKKAVDNYYCRVVGIDSIPTGSPAVSHIAMGLQESELEDGWYNGYNYHVFSQNDYDTEKTKAAAIENIKESFERFRNDPKYAAKFFARKFLTQWADSVCISTHNLDLVSRHVENPTKMMYHVVFGEGLIIGRWVMNVFMSVCYLCVIIYLVYALIKRNISTQEMLLLILIFGGMVFHQFWEGSSRYVMRYYVYWLPFAASGMNMILKKFR